jgi:hypothetical protein
VPLDEVVAVVRAGSHPARATEEVA